jgi:hypothetical protein
MVEQLSPRYVFHHDVEMCSCESYLLQRGYVWVV